ncbi:MAG: alpha/beta hydrolase, partial [Bacteroidota bacterium]
MTTSDSEMDDLKRGVDYVKELRGVEKIHLFGHSMGGGRAMLYTSRFPEEVDKLIVHGFGGRSYLPIDPPTSLPPEGSPVSTFTRNRIQEFAAAANCFDQVDPAIIGPVWTACQETDSLAMRWGPEGAVRYPGISVFGLTEEWVQSIEVP